MDIARADKFIYRHAGSGKTYVSKDLEALLEKVPMRMVSSCYAVVSTDAGPILYEMDVAYSGEPIIMRKFMHFSSFERWYAGTFVEV